MNSIRKIGSRFTGAALIGFLTAVFCCPPVEARIKPASVFGDHMVLQRDRTVPIWGTASAGEPVTVRFQQQEKTAVADAEGRWRIDLDAVSAGGPYSLSIVGYDQSISFRDVYMGEVWLCSGQSNMDMTIAKEDRYWCGVVNEQQEVAQADYPLIRAFDVPFRTSDQQQQETDSRWEICSPQTAGHMSAAAYFFAREIHQKLNVPVGLLTAAYGASTAEAWTSRAALEAEADLQFLLEDYTKKCQDFDSGAAQKKYEEELAHWKEQSAAAEAKGQKAPRKPAAPKNPHSDQHSPCVLYNAMTAPLVPYAIRGALWYQGESNIPTAAVYDRIMETLIRDWRKAWAQGDFPFLYAQLAAYGKPPARPCQGGGTTRVREAQSKNLNIPNTAMIVTIDIGESDNIHPKNKQDVGLRFSLAARALAYKENIVFSGPLYESMRIEGDKIVLSFKHLGGGLISKDTILGGFAVAGTDREFVWAQAKIEGDSVIVCSPQIKQPVAVRYAWDDFPTVSLYNREGLPASPFRTDNF